MNMPTKQDDDTLSPLRPGWYVQIDGAAADLDDWRRTLNEPFDPAAFRDGDGSTVFTSKGFLSLQEARDVRDRALAMIAQLNGAMSIMHAAAPVTLSNVFRVDQTGARHRFMIIDSVVIVLDRDTIVSTATTGGPPAPPRPSAAQTWLSLASQNDLIASLLAHLSRASDWYELYKTIECAEDLCGGERALIKQLGPTGKQIKQIKQIKTSANFYRHANEIRPTNLWRLEDAIPIVRWAARYVLDLKAVAS